MTRTAPRSAGLGRTFWPIFLGGSVVLGALLGARAAEAETKPQAQTAPNRRGVERVLVVVDGGHRGAEAERVRAAFVDHGFVRADHVVLARDATPASLARAVEESAKLSALHPAREVLLLTVVVGKAGEARGSFLLGDTQKPLDELFAALAEVPAIARVAFSDLCDARATRGFAISAGTSSAHLAATGPCSSPSSTDTWLTGLGGAADTNDDHQTSVAESFQFLVEEARARGEADVSVTASTARDPAFDVVLTQDTSFVDAAELVLPRLAHGEIPPLYRFFVQGEVTPFAEAHPRETREVRVLVPTGRLVVHVLAGEDSRGLDLRVSATELHHLGLTEGRWMSPAVLGNDAGVLSKPLHEASVAYGGALAGYATVAHGGGLRYAYAHPTYAFTVVGTAFLAGTSSAENENLYTVFGLRARAERRYFSGAPFVAVGAGLVGELALQSVRRKDASELAQTGYPIEERYRAGAVGPELFVNLRTTVGGTSFFGAELAAVFPFAPVAGQLQAFPRLEGALYAGLGF